MSFKPRRFVPRLEALDDRSLPSVTVTVFGTILDIEGDAAANTVVITDNGQAANCVTVVADGLTYQLTDTITDIVVSTFGGNDTVDYSLTGPLLQNRSVSVNLGTGADTFNGHLSDQTIGQTNGQPTNLFISAHGEGGGDHLNLDAQRLNTELFATVFVDFSGGHGKDTVSMNYTPGDIALGDVFLNSDQKK
jgi:hypothetical protein